MTQEKGFWKPEYPGQVKNFWSSTLERKHLFHQRYLWKVIKIIQEERHTNTLEEAGLPTVTIYTSIDRKILQIGITN